MAYGGGIDVDIDKLLSKGYDFKQTQAGKEPEPEQAPDAPAERELSRAEEIVDNDKGDPSLEHELREAAKTPAEEAAERQRLLAGARGKSPEEDAKEKRPDFDRDYQLKITKAVRGSLALNNVQKLIAIRNAEGLQRGMAKEADRLARRASGKGRVNTVQINSSLFSRVMQEIGDTGMRISQNDAANGFFCWYFGWPAGVTFPPEQEEKIRAVTEALNANASPSRANMLNYNASETLREKVDLLSSRLDSIAGLLEMISKDSVGLKSRSDKNYIATCYLILNMLMFAPPPAPGQRPGDIDMLAGGNAWDLMDGIAEAYEYFQTANGRELYKAKHGIRKWSPPTAPAGSGSGSWSGGAGRQAPAPAPYQGGSDDDDEYDDIPMDFDPLNDDFDDMGIGSDFAPAYMSDPNYDDGIEEGSPEYFAKKRAESALLERIDRFKDDDDPEGDESWD